MPIARLTVALDLTPLDHKVLNYTQFICQSLPIEKIYFIHVAPKLELPESYLNAHPEHIQPLDEMLLAQMHQVVTNHLNIPSQVEVEYDVLEGKLLNSLVHYSKVKLTDLMIVGKRDQESHSNLTAEKLAQQSPCSVLFVPETYSLDIRHILVPSDFSEHARLALETAIDISAIIRGDTIHVLYLYQVPLGHEKIGMSYEASAEEMRRYAEEDMQKFIAGIDPKGNQVISHVVDLDGRDKAHVIQEWLQQLDCQLLVMGSKGQSGLLHLFMGNLTEKLIKRDLRVPVLVIKKKNEHIGFFQALVDGQF